MKYPEIVEKYQKRKRTALTDSITTALSHMDEVSVDLGLLEESGLLNEVLGAVTLGLPFLVIAVTEQRKVILKRKTQQAALQDASFRAIKTGAGMAAGAAVMAAGLGAIPAIPVAVGVRNVLENLRTSAMVGQKVKQRTQRLSALNQARREGGLLRAELPQAPMESV